MSRKALARIVTRWYWFLVASLLVSRVRTGDGQMSESEILDGFLQMIRRVIREELKAAGHGDEWHDQRSSQCRASLGRNRWCKAVRERLQRSPEDAHARIIAGRYLLDTRGLSEELERASERPAPAVAKVAAEPAPDSSPRVARVISLLQGNR